MTEKRFTKLETKMDYMSDDIGEIKESMATLIERLSDYTDVKKDVDMLKRFRAWLIGIGTPAAASGGALLGWIKMGGGQ